MDFIHSVEHSINSSHSTLTKGFNLAWCASNVLNSNAIFWQLYIHEVLRKKKDPLYSDYMKYFEKNDPLYSDYMKYFEQKWSTIFRLHEVLGKKLSIIFWLHEVLRKKLSTIFRLHEVLRKKIVHYIPITWSTLDFFFFSQVLHVIGI